MYRKDFWERYAEDAGISKEKAKAICESVFLTLEKCIKEEDRVIFQNFGTFKHRIRPARNVKNMFGEGIITIPEKEILEFDFAKNFGVISEEQEKDPYYKKLGEAYSILTKESEARREMNRKLREREKISDIRGEADRKVREMKRKQRNAKKRKKKKSNDRIVLEKLIAGLGKTLKSIDLSSATIENNDE